MLVRSKQRLSTLSQVRRLSSSTFENRMTKPINAFTGPPSILDHDLNTHFPELLMFESTPAMEASELYKRIRPDVERIMNAVVVEELSVHGPVAARVLAASEPAPVTF